MLQMFKSAAEVGNFDDVPVLPPQVDPQVHLSRNVVDQPFYLICGKDTVLAHMSGEARLVLKNSPVNYFTLHPGDNTYVPAGTPHRVLIGSESVQLRYRAQDAGLEGVAWYCPGCDDELHRVEWDTAETMSQQAWHDACTQFNGDDGLRTCRGCDARHPRIEMTAFESWLVVAAELTAERAKLADAGKPDIS